MQVDDMFVQASSASKNVINNRQKTTVSKEGKLSVEIKFKNYVVKSEEKGETYSTDVCPARRMITSKKNKKSSWPAGIDAYAEVTSFTPTKDACEVIIDPATGERSFSVRTEIKLWDERARNYLQEMAEHAWSHDDPESLRLRNFVNEDGTIPSHYNRIVRPGITSKVSLPDKGDNNILRQRIAGPGSAYKVQPDAPLRLQNVESIVRLQLAKEEVKEKEPVDEDDPLANVQEDEVAEDQDQEGSKKRRTELVLKNYFKLECSGQVLLNQENYDPFLEHSERLHGSYLKNEHRLVPVEELRVNQKAAGRNLSFYLSDYSTPFNGDKQRPGVAVVVTRPDTDGSNLDTKNYMYVPNNGEAEASATFTREYNIYQYYGAPSKNCDTYPCKFIHRAEGDGNALKMGLVGENNIFRYSAIMAANWDVPIHAIANIHTSGALKNPENSPDKINDRPEVENVKGYYNLYIQTWVPDLLRFFKTRGIKVSPDWVEQDFAAFEVTRNQKRSINLEPANPQKRVSINSGGLEGAMLSLGNGKVKVCDITGKEKAMHHAWDGELLKLINAGTHEFYVLIGQAATREEKLRYARGEKGEYADEWVKSLVEGENGACYNIYAVRKDAKMSKDFYEPRPRIAKKEEEEEEETKGIKRERNEEEEDEEDEDEEEELSSSPKKSKDEE